MGQAVLLAFKVRLAVVRTPEDMLTHGLGAVFTGYHVAQLRLVFRLSKAACEDLFPDVLAPGHLAYIERFTPFTAPDAVHGLYKVNRRRDATGARLASVVEVRNIRRSCHLLPVTGAVVPRDWTSSTVLQSSDSFWVNPFSDLHMYMTLI